MIEENARSVESVSPTGETKLVTKLTIFLAIAVFATSIYANLPHALGLKQFYVYVPPFDGRDMSLLDHLGGEHRSIAQALSAGRGFADPFQEPTGPTAWVGPVLPALQAVLISIGGINAAVIMIALLQNLSLIFTGWVVLNAAARCRITYAPAVSLVLYFASTWLYFYSSYQFTHDTWLIMFLLTMLIFQTKRFWKSSFNPRTLTYWGLMGGVAALSSPVLGPVWLVLTLLLALSSRRVRPFLASSLVAAAVFAPWIVRNAIVFARFIPVKSNLFFEVYQSNALEPDGVLQGETGRNHPYTGAGPERTHYRKLGEVAYLDEYRAKTIELIRRDPIGYLTRAKNRMLAATLSYHPYTQEEGSRQILLRSLLYPWPFLGLIVVVFTRGWASDQLKLIAVMAYITYLTPYMLVAYYRRYAMLLLGLQVMFEIWALDAVYG
jgi:hypothetical protein